MPSSSLDSQESDPGTLTPLLPVAEYVRMSTDHQRYSTANQAAAIRAYADAHRMRIVRTFMDEGKSGLDIERRGGLQELLAAVQGGTCEFRAILVYDISRWGRFQNADESAYYEYLCTRVGIKVVYCAEPFQNDNSPLDTIVKSVKRAMAGEYSRELSTKVFAGQCRLIRLGYRQGGPAGFGLRRMLIDSHHDFKTILQPGERKSLQTDRVVLAPGPAEEVAVVLRIYEDFVEGHRSEGEIAQTLNALGATTDKGRPWTRGTIHQVLTNEKYIGNNVYNRTSSRLRQRPQRNAPEDWIRCDGAFQGIVPPTLFESARHIIDERCHRLSDADMLARLQTLLLQTGSLSGLIIDEQEDMPSSSSYQSRFGGLLRAYQLIGYAPERDYRFVAVNRALRAWRPQVVTGIAQSLRDVGAHVHHDEPSGIIVVNGEWSAAVIIARCIRASTYRSKWRLRFDSQCQADLTVAVRMDQDNETARDYYIFPRIDCGIWPSQLGENNIPLIESYRFDTLQILEDLAERTLIKEAA
ncbi:recombinase family protein [Bordetella muralis]|uniref:recombinase family protein n=1 Tax=Bordetella muralis TaxID=1649130 RepID=UPI0039EE0A1D